MRYFPLTTAALFGLSLLTVGVLPAHAQNISVEGTLMSEATSTPTMETPAPDPFPIATTTSPEPSPGATTTPVTPTEKPLPVIEKTKPVSAPKKKVEVVVPATTTSSTTASSTLGFIPPPLVAQSIGSIYAYARHAPLDADTTRGFLGVAALLALLGSFMVQKNLLDRMMFGLTRFLSPTTRSLPQPQAKR